MALLGENEIHTFLVLLKCVEIVAELSRILKNVPWEDPGEEWNEGRVTRVSSRGVRFW